MPSSRRISSGHDSGSISFGQQLRRSTRIAAIRLRAAPASEQSARLHRLGQTDVEAPR